MNPPESPARYFVIARFNPAPADLQKPQKLQFFYGGLCSFSQWTDNIDLAAVGHNQEDVVDALARLPKDVQRGAFIGEVRFADGARQWVRFMPDLPSEDLVEGPPTSFFKAVRAVAQRVAQDAAGEQGLELLPEEPLHVRYEGPLAEYRADWLFKTVSYGGHDSQLQVHVESKLWGLSRLLEFWSPNCKAFGKLAMGRWLAYWTNNPALKSAQAAAAWAGGNGRDTGKDWHLRSRDCSCQFCQEFYRTFDK